MTARLLSAAIGIPLLLLVVWADVPWLFTLTAATLAVLGAWELCRLLARSSLQPQPWIALPWTGAFVVSSQFGNDAMLAVMTGGVLASLVLLLARKAPLGASASWGGTVTPVLYLGLTLAHAPLLYALDQGQAWVLLWLFTTFATDTGAFFTGRLLGRHPMAPSISPGKTWEGALGGWTAGVAASVALSFVLSLGLVWWQALALGGVVAVAAQLGDLVESLFKRSAQVKEAGSLIPGHGGLLDRLDSVVLTLPVVYYGVVAITGG